MEEKIKEDAAAQMNKVRAKMEERIRKVSSLHNFIKGVSN